MLQNDQSYTCFRMSCKLIPHLVMPARVAARKDVQTAAALNDEHEESKIHKQVVKRRKNAL
jgi:hypothetical protein